MQKITVVTAKKFYHPETVTPYIANILKEYELLKAALEAKGVSVERTYWDDPHYDWSQTDAAVVRTVWDYFERSDAFVRWMATTAAKTRLINPLPLLQWNTHKYYLRDLRERGVRIVPTQFIDAGSDTTLRELSNATGWKQLVVKPAISAAAFHTYKITEEEIDAKEALFHSLVAKRDMLVQEYLPTITAKGEASLMVFNGNYTHAVLKKAKAGDFRVQDDFGGTVHPYEPTQEEIRFAEHANAQCPVPPAYGRVDIVWDAEGGCYLSEMEFLDPEIWLRFAPHTAERLAEGILSS
jgi:glutathione synthase/RimK-type ligase-like ATP-grasp enzyme